MEPEMTRRQMLAQRWAEYPLIRMLILNSWFRVIVVLLVLGVLAAVVAIPTVWVATPRGFRPVVKISLVDRAQGWMLRRSAQRFAARGQSRESLRAWQAALANNRADVGALRESLRYVSDPGEVDGDLAREMLMQAAWLLRLTQTNRLDAGLAALVYGRFELYEDVLGLLEPVAQDLSLAEEAAYLKALFHAGRMETFSDRWPTAADRLARDPELALYHAAYQAGWGPPGTVAEGKRRLAAAGSGDRGELAIRLELAVSRHGMDLGAYSNVLERLDETGAARLADHLEYWRMLRNAGRTDEARRLAEGSALAPASPRELVELAGTYAALRLPDRGRKLYERYAAQFGDADAPWAARVWVGYASLLIENRNWQELRTMAIELRTLRRAGPAMAGFSALMEGRALHSLLFFDEAAVSFRRAVQLGFPSPEMALQGGIDLLRLGFPALAWDLLKPLEPALAGNAVYWQALADAAHLLKRDAKELLRVATEGHRLRPRNSSAQLNYAAALLINRARPEEAAEVTLDYLARNTNAVGARLIHSAALAMVQRYAEADDLLKTVDVRSLGDRERTFYHLTAFEVHLGLQQFEHARADAGRIRTEHLFPNQVEWIEAMRQRVATAPNP